MGLCSSAVVLLALTGESDRQWAERGEEDTIMSEFLDHNKVRFERLTGVSADVIVHESRGSIGSDPFRGRLRTLGHVAEALLEVAPRVPGTFRGKTFKIGYSVKGFFLRYSQDSSSLPSPQSFLKSHTESRGTHEL